MNRLGKPYFLFGMRPTKYALSVLCLFLPELVKAMERHDHLRVPDEVQKRLFGISLATVDRLLKPERERTKQGVSTTRSGNLLKHQIQVRTFADWDDVIPGC